MCKFLHFRLMCISLLCMITITGRVNIDKLPICIGSLENEQGQTAKKVTANTTLENIAIVSRDATCNRGVKVRNSTFILSFLSPVKTIGENVIWVLIMSFLITGTTVKEIIIWYIHKVDGKKRGSYSLLIN